MSALKCADWTFKPLRFKDERTLLAINQQKIFESNSDCVNINKTKKINNGT